MRHRSGWRIIAAALVLGSSLVSCGEPPGAATLDVAASGSNPFAPLDWTDDGTATTVATPAPPSSAPPAALDLWSSGRIVLAATDRGITRSTDGGHHWRTVLRGSSMTSVIRGPTGFAAIGSTGRYGRITVTATSHDGVHWRMIRSRSTIGYGDPTIVMDGKIGLSAVAANKGPDGGGIERTTDRGRHWHELTGPARGLTTSSSSGGLTMLADGTVFATGFSGTRRCRGSVFVSHDLGRRWQQLPSSCERFNVTAVQFLDAEHGVAVGGFPSKYGGGQVIETTSDGGRTWQTSRHRASQQQVGRHVSEGIGGVHFVTPTSGYVMVGMCIDGLGGPCGGTLEWTSDSGAHLRPLADPALEGWLSVASTGGHRLVGAAAGRLGSDVVGLSRDRGRHWRLQLAPQGVDSTVAYGAGHYLFWRNSLGSFVSHSSGTRWRRHRPRVLRHRDLINGTAVAEPDDILSDGGGGPPVTFHASVDGGRRWRTVHLTGRHDHRREVNGFALGRGGVAAAVVGPGDATYGHRVANELFVSRDGGQQWSLASLPSGLHLSYAALAVGRQAIVIDQQNVLATSTDSGATWSIVTLSNRDFCEPSVLGDEIWQLCDTGGGSMAWVLHSDDLGTTWVGHLLPRWVADSVDAVILTGVNAASIVRRGDIWRTTDGGGTWRQHWPHLTGEGAA